jgi:hypothetical protein
VISIASAKAAPFARATTGSDTPLKGAKSVRSSPAKLKGTKPGRVPTVLIPNCSAIR